jgi:DNA-binding FrmR family transcriptional regulator
MSKAIPAVTDQRAIISRLNRASGQLAGVVRMIEEGRDCEQVVGQLAAISKAVNSAAFAIVFGGLKQCVIEEREDADDVAARLQKVLMALA